MKNFFIKQWFYILFFFGVKIERKNSLYAFRSFCFNARQWDIDTWYYSKYQQSYGKVVYNAKLSGIFEETRRPALWLINDRNTGCYFEIDIELISRENNHPKLVFTSWINKYEDSSAWQDGRQIKRINYKRKWLINRLQSEFHEYTIDWNEKRIKFYIDGILAGIIPYSFNAQMTIAAGNVWMREIKAYRNES